MVSSVFMVMSCVLAVGLVRVGLRLVHETMANLNVMMQDSGRMTDGPKVLPYPARRFRKKA